MPVLKNGDININYETCGEGFPLVLGHGYTASVQTWQPQIDALSKKYRLVLYDARGHGLSSAPAGAENYTLDALVEDLHRFMLHLGIEKAFVGGLSMGGATAIGYASRHPERVRALLVFDNDGGQQPPDDAATLKIRDDCEKVALERGMADVARFKIATGSAPRPVLEDPARQGPYLERMARLPVNGYVGVGRQRPWKAGWLAGAAENIAVPTLLVVGGDDAIKSGVKRLHRLLKGSRYVEIPGCVHGTAQWRPDAFNEAVLDFLESVENW